MKHEVRSSLWPGAVIFLVFGLAATVLVGPFGHAQDTDGFQIIVNASNPNNEMSRKQLERVFLKKESKWPTGFRVTVVDQNTKQPARIAFSRAILQREPASIEAYWQKLIFSGMGTPPLKLASDEAVVEFVGKNVGSVGYVSAGTTLGDSVKVLEVTP